MQTKPIIRNFVLRFAIDEDPKYMRLMVAAWNRRFARCCEGVGYFPDVSVVEEFRCGGTHGGALQCNAFYLRADTKLWEEILSSRTCTVADPVLAGQQASRAQVLTR